MRYRERRAPSWIDVQHIKVGTTLYMSFSNFEGRTYLTDININPCATSSKALVAQDELLICRDHFAIQNIYGSADRPGNLEARGQSVFYHTINLRQVGSKELTIRGFSDVSTRMLSKIIPNDQRGFLLELSFLSAILVVLLNGTHCRRLSLDRLIGFQSRHIRNPRLIDANIMISATFQASPRSFMLQRLSVFSVIDKDHRRISKPMPLSWK